MLRFHHYYVLTSQDHWPSIHIIGMGNDARLMERQMPDFTFTIFDGHPSQNRDRAWPHHRDVSISAASVHDAAVAVEKIVESEGRACGEYSEGTKLWYRIWNDGIIACTDYVVL